MFRRKDTEPSRPDGQTEAGASRPGGDQGPKGPVQPEIPRRRVDIPTAPAASTSAPATPASTPPEPSRTPATATEDAQGKRLIVGQGIRLSGEITACDRLVVEGYVEVTLNETRAVEIAESGRFIGGCEVEEAEISGTYEGELTVRNRLLIHSSGRVEGTIRYGELEIERGGRLTGNVSMLGEQTPGMRSTGRGRSDNAGHRRAADNSSGSGDSTAPSAVGTGAGDD